VLELHSDYVLDAMCFAANNTIASVSRDKTIKIWSAYSQKIERVMQNPNSACAIGVALSPDATLIAVAFFDYTVLIYDNANGEIVRILKIHTEGILSIRFQTNRTILLGSVEGQLLLINL
jgi:WD40 repeat protein